MSRHGTVPCAAFPPIALIGTMARGTQQLSRCMRDSLDRAWNNSAGVGEPFRPPGGIRNTRATQMYPERWFPRDSRGSCHFCGWIEGIPEGTRHNDGLEADIREGSTAATVAWKGSPAREVGEARHEDAVGGRREVEVEQVDRPPEGQRRACMTRTAEIRTRRWSAWHAGGDGSGSYCVQLLAISGC